MFIFISLASDRSLLYRVFVDPLIFWNIIWKSNVIPFTMNVRNLRKCVLDVYRDDEFNDAKNTALALIVPGKTITPLKLPRYFLPEIVSD